MTGSTKIPSPKLAETEIAALAATVRAPEALHERVQAMVDAATASLREHRVRLPVRVPLPVGARLPVRVRLAGAGALGAAAAVAAVLALALAGGSGALTVQRTAALTLRQATLPAPQESAANHAQLDVGVEGVAFPYWRERFGWRSAGARTDRIAGRAITTVFYADAQGRRIGYSIAAGRAPRMAGGALKWHLGIPYRVLNQDGATVVAWPRHGHLCVVSGRGVSAATLLRLAGWSGAPSESA